VIEQVASEWEAVACTPRFATRRRPERDTRGGEVARLFAALAIGEPLPWQRDLWDIGLELREDGLPAYDFVTATVQRQTGKTLAALAIALHRALAWGRPQMVAFSAQTGLAARKKILDDFMPMLRRSPLRAAITATRRAQGAELIEFEGGSRLDIIASREYSGHGQSYDLVFLDEAFADLDSRRQNALMPALATKKDGQIWVVSTQGTDASAYLARITDQGRAAAMEDSGSGMAFLEFSADPDADHRDPATWRGCHPGLGRLIPEAALASALRSMEAADFKRAYLNIPSRQYGGERAIPEEMWAAGNNYEYWEGDPRAQS
jgi:phage terminase large subunit-like protein